MLVWWLLGKLVGKWEKTFLSTLTGFSYKLILKWPNNHNIWVGFESTISHFAEICCLAWSRLILIFVISPWLGLLKLYCRMHDTVFYKINQCDIGIVNSIKFQNQIPVDRIVYHLCHMVIHKKWWYPRGHWKTIQYVQSRNLKSQ